MRLLKSEEEACRKEADPEQIVRVAYKRLAGSGATPVFDYRQRHLRRMLRGVMNRVMRYNSARLVVVVAARVNGSEL